MRVTDNPVAQRMMYRSGPPYPRACFYVAFVMGLITLSLVISIQRVLPLYGQMLQGLFWLAMAVTLLLPFVSAAVAALLIDRERQLEAYELLRTIALPPGRIVRGAM